MDFIDCIKLLAQFTSDHEKENLWDHIIFDDGCIYAQGPKGGALCQASESQGITLAVPAKNLLKALQAIGSSGIKMARTKDFKLQLKGPEGSAQIEGLELQEFPIFPAPSKKIKWIPVQGLDQVARYSWCASADKTRLHLTGIHFSPQGYLEVSDGHALIRQYLKSPIPHLPDIILPPILFADVPETAFLGVEDDRCYLAPQPPISAGYRVASIIRGPYPDITPLLDAPKSLPAIGVDRAQFIQLLRRVKMSYHEVLLVRPAASQQLQLQVPKKRTERLFDFEASLDFRDMNAHPGPTGKIMCNAKILEALLSSATEPEAKLHIAFHDAGGLDPLLIEESHFLAVLMPMRLYD